jgi:hypothetical protein
VQTTDKRKLTWIAVVVAILFFAPALFNMTVRMVYSVTSAFHPEPPAKPSAAHPAPPVAIAPPVTPPPPTVVSAKPVDDSVFTGYWGGNGYLPNRASICKLTLEVKETPDDDSKFQGYLTTICEPVNAMMANKNKAFELMTKGQLAPVSTAFSGTMQQGKMAFEAHQSIGGAQVGCPVKTLTLSEFGTDQIAAVWQDASCGGGQMLLRRTDK